MTITTQTVEQFDQVLKDARANAPAVGLAALAGKSPNKHLKNAWKELNDCGVTLKRNSMNYRWRALHEVNPKLAHSIEEVLVFGDALFSAWGQKQTPEDLSKEYLDIKQRFSKIIKETESVAAPKEEKTFSFFGNSSAKKADPKTELRLDNLDTLLEEAHNRSRSLLFKTESDLVSERAFHRAAEWYVLALETAQRSLEKLADSKDQKTIDDSLLSDLKTALMSAQVTTNAILTQTNKLLRVKEQLHNKSIMFLTAHENTFTVIQGHLRSWKDIKTQTEALNGLSQTVKAGMSLMEQASKGVEEPLQNWNPKFITPDTIKSLSDSFAQYDGEISTLIGSLADNTVQDKPKFTRWDDWNATKKDLIEPILDNGLDVTDPAAAVRLRPTLRKNPLPENAPAVSMENSQATPAEAIDAMVGAAAPFYATPKTWTRIDEMVVQKNLNAYNKLIQGNLSIAFAQSMGWSPMETITRVSRPLHALSHAVGYNDEVANRVMSPAVRSQIQYNVIFQDPMSIDWEKIASQKVIDYTDSAWAEQLSSWLAEHDDLDFSNLMQWNDLVYDLLILEQDDEQKNAVVSPKDDDHRAIRQGLLDRIRDFANEPGLSQDTLRTWNLNGLIARYAIVLDAGTDVANKIWDNFHSPVAPVDWNGASFIEKLAKENLSNDNKTFAEIASSKISPYPTDLAVGNSAPRDELDDLLRNIIATARQEKIGKVSGKKVKEKRESSADSKIARPKI